MKGAFKLIHGVTEQNPAHPATVRRFGHVHTHTLTEKLDKEQSRNLLFANQIRREQW